ncbi:MAG: DNA methyltransferase [Candidatus Heimdallarchaeota archaeon]
MPTLVLKDYQEDRGADGVYDKRNTLNNLTGKQWLFSTKTVIPKDYPHHGNEKKRPNGFFPLPSGFCKEIVEIFSKPGETILDPFAGFGSTLIGTFLANSNTTAPKRECIGIESNDMFIKEYLARTRQIDGFKGSMIRDDPIPALSKIRLNSMGLVFADIPIRRIFSTLLPNSNNSIPNSNSQALKEAIELWLSTVCPIILTAAIKLKENRYIVLTIPGGEGSSFSSFNFAVSSLLAHNLQTQGIPLKAERIWFIPDPEKEIDEFLPLARRILVFRNERSLTGKTKRPPLFFNGLLPIGCTEIIHKAYPPSFNHKLRSQHGGMKPPELAYLLIEKFSRYPRGLILDPFAGVGGTLLGASLAGRRAIGIDINRQWQEIYYQVAEKEGLLRQEFIVGDSRKKLPHAVPDDAVDLVFTDVPYWAMDKLEKTRGRFSRAGEKSKAKLHSSLKKFDQAQVISLEEWTGLLKEVFSLCYSKLASEGYCVVFIGNMYRTIIEERAGQAQKIGRYLLLSSILARILLEIGYQFEREIIWYSPDKSLHVFGYPYSYIPSIVHQSILVFKKGK